MAQVVVAQVAAAQVVVALLVPVARRPRRG
jgi:hypothetical protein